MNECKKFTIDSFTVLDPNNLLEHVPKAQEVAPWHTLSLGRPYSTAAAKPTKLLAPVFLLQDIVKNAIGLIRYKYWTGPMHCSTVICPYLPIMSLNTE